MPVVRERAVRPNSRALVVGNGPSASMVAWPEVARHVAATRGSWPDAFLMNRVALGRTPGAFSVAVGPEILREYRAAELWRRSRVLTNCPWKVVVPDEFAATFGEILSAPGSLFAPDDWPPHASGPLAVWSAAALGYEEVILFGLDGTAGPPQAAQDWLQRARTWEWAIRSWRRARAAPGATQRLVRAWPAAVAVPIDRDPLAPEIDESLVL